MLKNEHAQESRRERSKREKLERIEGAARRLFAEHGFAGTTTRAIAEAAEIGTGTLFVYFPEKLDLLMHLYRQDLVRVIYSELDALPADMPLADSCLRVFNAVYDFYAEDPGLARSFVKELMFLELERQAELFKTTVRYIERLGDLVTAAKGRGEVRADVPVPLAAHQLFGLYYWGLVNWLAGLLDRRQLTDQMRMSIDLLMRGLAVPSEEQKGESDGR
jgi:AcrR family transcriptional regulator